MRGRPIRLLATTLATGLLLAGGAGGARAAAAAAPARGLFSISPGDTELFAAPGLVLRPTVVGNSTGVPLKVRVTAVLVHQTRSGAFAYLVTARARRAARRVLAVSTTGFALGGHAEHPVLERWRTGAGRHAAYAGVVFRAELPGRAHGVRTIDQLLGIDLLGLRGSRPARGRTTGISVGDRPAHRLAFTVSLRNVGGSFGTPSRIGLLVRASDGRVVSRVAMAPGVILPGVVRDFVAALPTRLPRGSYTAVASATLHGRVTPSSLHFRVTAGGELPAPSLVAGGVRSGGTVGGRDEVSVALRNQGTRPGRPRGTVSLYEMHAGVAEDRPVAHVALGGAPLAPGRSRREHLAFGRLRAGTYQTVVRYAAPFVPTESAYIDFTARPSSSLPAVAARWARSHLAVLLMGLALLLGLGYSTRRARHGAAPRQGGVRLRPLP